MNLSNQIQLRKRALYSYCARSLRQQGNLSRKKKNSSAIFTLGFYYFTYWPNFSLGMEFLTPQKERKEKENKEQARPMSSRFAGLTML